MAAITARTREEPDTWLTPQWILSQLGNFDLDPCAATQNPTWTGTMNHFTEEEDGLAQAWDGRVFMNPPFSKTTNWIRKHADHGNGISLVPATVESIVWREVVWKKAKAIFLLHGRTRFCRPDGSTTTGRPLRSVCLIAWSYPDAVVLQKSTYAGVLLTEWRAR